MVTIGSSISSSTPNSNKTKSINKTPPPPSCNNSLNFINSNSQYFQHWTWTWCLTGSTWTHFRIINQSLIWRCLSSFANKQECKHPTIEYTNAFALYWNKNSEKSLLKLLRCIRLLNKRKSPAAMPKSNNWNKKISNSLTRNLGNFWRRKRVNLTNESSFSKTSEAPWQNKEYRLKDRHFWKIKRRANIQSLKYLWGRSRRRLLTLIKKKNSYSKAWHKKAKIKNDIISK